MLAVLLEKFRDEATEILSVTLRPVPKSLYVGRLPAGAVYREAALQLAWAIALAVLTWWLWRRAATRVTVLGG
jgi:ABC-type uncharacterized transport system permease subunit